MEKESESQSVDDKYIYYGTTNGDQSRIEIINIESIKPDQDQNRVSTEEIEEDNVYQSKLYLNLKQYTLSFQIIEDSSITTFEQFENQYDLTSKLCMCSFNFLKPKKKIKTPPKYITYMAPTIDKESMLVGDSLGTLKQISVKSNRKGQIKTRNFGDIHRDEIISICVSKDNKYIYTCSKDGYIKKISLTEINKTKVEASWKCQKTHSEMIDLYWTRQKMIDVEPTCMILSNDQQNLLIGINDRFLISQPTKDLNQAKQSNYMYKGITSQVQDRKNNNMFIGDRKGNVVQILADSQGKDELQHHNSFLGIHEGKVTDLFISDNNLCLYSCSREDMQLFVYSIENSEVVGMFNLDFFSQITSVMLINFKSKDYVFISNQNKQKVFSKDNEEGEFILPLREHVNFLCK